MWNDSVYRKYYGERMQPSIDLAKRIEIESCQAILDIGCGSGMSTQAIMQEMPEAKRIVGVDLSTEMLSQAKQNLPEVEWIERDCSQSLEDLGKFDVVFSNAFLQWLDQEDQKKFIRETKKNVEKGGVFAIQIPNFDSLPVSKCCQKVKEKWENLGKLVPSPRCENYSPAEYYELFSEAYEDVTIWRTKYYHKMGSVSDIVSFVRATAIHAVEQQLSATDWKVFCEELEKELSVYYQPLKNGTVLFPFDRIFILARDS